ncbi:hypothetical protein MGI_05386, partial [Candida albicans P75016]
VVVIARTPSSSSSPESISLSLPKIDIDVEFVEFVELAESDVNLDEENALIFC